MGEYQQDYQNKREAEHENDTARQKQTTHSTYPAKAKTKLTSGMTVAKKVTPDNIPTDKVFRNAVDLLLILKRSRTLSLAPKKAKG